MEKGKVLLSNNTLIIGLSWNVGLNRVPKALKGSLDEHWRIRDSEGYILNNDGTRSYCIHQWDRWYSDLKKFIDTKIIKWLFTVKRF